ncbi:ABC transporter permease [Aquamicrobium defluvii]|uniref:ABC transporter permease n=2 Tax=Aquamicrobium defluvii TaxID=69279 RepID=A0A011TLM8_9HYPH|nr:ABC transporter permease [Aquamicrobium defluvii]EZQ14566.1 ABC transporter permease [Halopseudomonas bauzanensis]
MRFVARRLAQSIPLLIAVIVLNFFLLKLAPGDAASVFAGQSGSSSPEYMAKLRHQFGLDVPTHVQLINYVTNILTLDLGYSFRNQMTVAALIFDRLAATLLLMGTALLISVVLGVLLGLIAAMRVRTWKDNVISVFSVVVYAMPTFWIGLMLIVVFSIKLEWFPATGMESVAMFNTGWDRVADIATHLVLPSVTLSLLYMAVYTRLMRGSVLENSNMDYVTTARAKGLTESSVTFRHIVRNAILPVVTMAGVQLGNLLGGSVVVEAVFGWPGIGQLAFQAIFARDMSLLLGIFLISACLVIVVNLLVDLLYTFLDPRMDL